MSSAAARRAKGFPPISKVEFPKQYARQHFWDPRFVYADYDVRAWVRWTKLTSHLSGEKQRMIISVVHEDGSENEFELIHCCAECAHDHYKWNGAQYQKFNDICKNNAMMENVPSNITSNAEFAEFIRTSL